MVVAAYAYMSLVTLCYLMRHGRRGPIPRLRQIMAASAWPVYWPLFHGAAATAVPAYWMGVAIFPGFYLYIYGDRCEGALACAQTFGKSLGWAFLWPGYALGSMMQSTMTVNAASLF